MIDNLDQGGQTRSGSDSASQISRLESISRSRQVKLVLLTIGGNDLGFADKLKGCYLWGNIHGCLTNHAALARELNRVRARLVSAYRETVAAAGGSPLLVVGYPDIFPPPNHPDRCAWLTRPMKVNIAWFTNELDSTIASAASVAHVNFVSTRGVMSEHWLCTGHAWIRALGGKPGDIFGDQQQGHPLEEGQRAIAHRVEQWIADHSRLLSVPNPSGGGANTTGSGSIGSGYNLGGGGSIGSGGPVLLPEVTPLGPTSGPSSFDFTVKISNCPSGWVTSNHGASLAGGGTNQDMFVVNTGGELPGTYQFTFTCNRYGGGAPYWTDPGFPVTVTPGWIQVKTASSTVPRGGSLIFTSGTAGGPSPCPTLSGNGFVATQTGLVLELYDNTTGGYPVAKSQAPYTDGVATAALTVPVTLSPSHSYEAFEHCTYSGSGLAAGDFYYIGMPITVT